MTMTTGLCLLLQWIVPYSILWILSLKGHRVGRGKGQVLGQGCLGSVWGEWLGDEYDHVSLYMHMKFLRIKKN